MATRKTRKKHSLCKIGEVTYKRRFGIRVIKLYHRRYEQVDFMICKNYKGVIYEKYCAI